MLTVIPRERVMDRTFADLEAVFFADSTAQNPSLRGKHA
jgi:hypothetical protein